MDLEQAYDESRSQMRVMQEVVPSEDSWEEAARGPTPIEQFAQQVKDALNSYGYDQATVDAWFSSNEAAWESMHREQEIARGELAQKQMQEASDYVKGILDRAVADLRAKDEANTEQMK